MRLIRAVALTMAILLAATLSQALVSPSRASVAPAAHEALMEPNHDLRAGATEVGNDHFVIYGTLTTYRGWASIGASPVAHSSCTGRSR